MNPGLVSRVMIQVVIMGRVNSELVDVPEEGGRAGWLGGLEGERDRGVRVVCVDSIKMQRKKLIVAS